MCFIFEIDLTKRVKAIESSKKKYSISRSFRKIFTTSIIRGAYFTRDDIVIA